MGASGLVMSRYEKTQQKIEQDQALEAAIKENQRRLVQLKNSELFKRLDIDGFNQVVKV